MGTATGSGAVGGKGVGGGASASGGAGSAGTGDVIAMDTSGVVSKGCEDIASPFGCSVSSDESRVIIMGGMASSSYKNM